MDLSLKIDTTVGISSDRFCKDYLLPQKPLVIRGLAKDTVAGREWSFGYFKKKMGDLDVDLFDNNNKKSAGSAYTKPDLKMPFSDYLDILEKNETTGLRMFLANLFKHNAHLRSEFPCPEIFSGMLDQMGLMFFGGKGLKVRLHYDIDMSNVLHTHFGGRKRVVLISPAYSRSLYRLPLNTYSLVDIDNPDYEKYPALRQVKGYEVILEHGDSIFMPEGYWHLMTYLDAGFSVSYRKLALGTKHKAQGLLNIGLLLPADKVLNRLPGDWWLRTKEEIAGQRAHCNLNHYSDEFSRATGA